MKFLKYIFLFLPFLSFAQPTGVTKTGKVVINEATTPTERLYVNGSTRLLGTLQLPLSDGALIITSGMVGVTAGGGSVPAAGANGTILISNGTAYAWGQGTNLSIANGANIDALKLGTGLVSTTVFNYIANLSSDAQAQITAKFTLPSLTSGSVLFSNGTTISQNNANFFWDNANLAFSINGIKIWRNGSTTTNRNIGVGSNFGSITTGFANVAVGDSAMLAVTSSRESVAVGHYAMRLHQTGRQNVAVGEAAMMVGTAVEDNTAIGFHALLNNTNNLNTAVGSSALAAAGGSGNTAVGYSAGSDNLGANNIFIGNGAGNNITGTRNNNVFLGGHSGSGYTSSNNMVFSDGAGNLKFDFNSSAVMRLLGTSYNSAGILGTSGAGDGTIQRLSSVPVNLGGSGLTSLTTGYVPFGNGTSAFGNKSTFTFTSASDKLTINSIEVWRNGASNSGNVGVGGVVFGAITTGMRNVAMGDSASRLNTTGAQNTAIGYRAMENNTTGGFNVAIGGNAGRSANDGLSNNTYVNFNGAGVTTGNNVFIGDGSAVRIRANSTGDVGINTGTNTLLATGGGLDIASGLLTEVGGANTNSSSGLRSDATSKVFRKGAVHYTNAEEPLAMLMASSTATGGIVYVGGGSSVMNASTQVRIYTAANNTTTTGTEAIRVDSLQRVGIGTTAPTVRLEVVGVDGVAFRETQTINTNNTTPVYGGAYSGNKMTMGTLISSSTQNTYIAGGGNAIGEPLNVFAVRTLQGVGTANTGRERLRVNEFGNVGIQMASPASNFTVGQSSTGEGTVSNSAGGTTVTGVGTLFLNTFKVGDNITIAGQTVAISAIASNTSMTTAAITNANSAVTYTLTGGARFDVKGNGRVGIGTATPIVTLDVIGVTKTDGFQPAISTKTANYTITTSDNFILVDATSGNITITIPAASAGRNVYTVKKIDASVNTVTISGATIDGVSSKVISTQYTSLTFQSDLTNYYIK